MDLLPLFSLKGLILWRLFGVQISNLDSHEQLSLLEEKDEQLSKAVDGLKEKYGMDVVKRAMLLLKSR